MNKKQRVTIRFRMPRRGSAFLLVTALLGRISRVVTRLSIVLARRFQLVTFWNNQPLRSGALSLAAIIVCSQIAAVLNPLFVQRTYALGTAESLLSEQEQSVAAGLTFDAAQQQFNFDSKHVIQSGQADSAGGGVTATAYADISKGISVTDSTNKVSFKLTPKFRAATGQKDGDRIVYPLIDNDGWAVYTMTGVGTKEDILLKSATQDTASFSYDMVLGDGLEARAEADGSIGIYGNSLFSSTISTGTQKDAELLQKARKNAPKNTRLFVIPAPSIKESDGKQSKVTAKYELSGSSLTVDVQGLKKGNYPLTIDPSIYVVTASQFMYGNNESNINFDVTNKLIKKNPTSGGRISSWQTTTSLTQGYYGGAVVAADGYLYQIGGISQGYRAFTTTGTGSYTVPAGVTSITVKTWGGGGGGGGYYRSANSGGNGGGGGFAQATLSVTPGETLTYYVGTGGTKGSFTGAGGNGGGFSALARGNTFLVMAGGGGGGGGNSGVAGNGGGGGAGGGSSGVNGSAGAGTSPGGPGGGGTSSAGGSGGTAGVSGTTGKAGASNAGGDAGGSAGACATAVTGTGGAGGTGAGGKGGSSATCANGGGGGGGYFGGGGSGSTYPQTQNSPGGGGGGSGYASGTSTTLTAGSGTTPGNSGDALRGTAGNGGVGGLGAGSNSDGVSGTVIIDDGTSTNSSVGWAQFDPGNGTIVNANPGNGTCTNWCSSFDYNLPASRANLSIVAYNGYLYALGGNDASGPNVQGHKYNTIYVAKLGSNGEPRLWHPTDNTQANWVYWYHDDSGMTLPDKRIFSSAVAYNNKMYVIGGLDDSTSVGAATSTVWSADILPNGKLGSWSTSTALTSGGPGATYGASSFAYNDKLYLVGGAGSVGGTPFTSNVYYILINSDGSLGSSWVHTSDFATGRVSGGGIGATVWGGYVYITGGCSATNSSGYCTNVLSDTQIASINADGSLDSWITLNGVTRQTMGSSLIAWRNNLYAVGGCSSQDATTGACTGGITSGISYSPINSQGDISPMRSSSASGAGTCTGSTPTNCDIAATGSVGSFLGNSVVNNGYLYVLGGCTANNCSTTSSGVSFTQVSAGGDLVQPSSCPTGSTATNGWCVMNTSMPAGVAGGAATVFNDTIYIVGGTSNNSALNNAIYRASVTPATGLVGSWSTDTLTTAGAASVGWNYVTTRANPSNVTTTPGNLYIFGGCTNTACTARSAGVYKCNIGTNGAISGCTTSNQLQLSTARGLMGGTVYANYIYLVGGYTGAYQNNVLYAKFDNSNNVVTTSSGWATSTATFSASTGYISAFAYNGYLYAVGGFTTTPINTVQYIKINTSDGSLDTSGWTNPAITLSNPRYGQAVSVSNGRAYVVGGCITYSSGCTGTTNTVQSFRIFNNDSGGAASYTQSSNTGADVIGASTAILNGYIYQAGGCTAIDCSSMTANVYYAQIGADGTIGTWNTTTALPASRSWGGLVAAGGTLYYVGGNDSSNTPQPTIYYATPSSGTISSWSTASNGLPASRSHFGAAVWNNRLYVAGGLSNISDSSASPTTLTTAGSGTYTVPAGVTSITVKAWGAGGGGANGNGVGAAGGNGGGGGFAQATLSVTPGENLTYYVGTAGSKAVSSSSGGNGGGFSGLARGGTYLIQAGGGGGGGGAVSTSAGGAGGAGGGSSGIAGGGGAGSATVAGGGGGGTSSAGGTAGTAGTSGTTGAAGAANAGGDGGGTVTNCTTAVTGTGGAGGTGGGGKSGTASACETGGGGGGGRYGGGGGGSGSAAGLRSGGGGGGGSDFVSGTGTIETAGSGQTPGNSGDSTRGTAGTGGTGSLATNGATDGQPGTIAFYPSAQSTVYVSPQLNSGGNITGSWTTSTSFTTPRENLSVVAYANNLYVIGGDDGTNYLSDVQYAKLSTSDGSISSWSYTTSLPRPVSGGSAFAANGYMYVVGGRSAANTCSQSTLVAPISSNTTIASGNNPTGLGAQWDESIQKFSGARYGASAVYNGGKLYLQGGGCSALIGTGTGVTNDRAYTTALLTQPQIAKYSISFDTDTNVYPQRFLLNGVDNSIGAQWQLKYRTMSDPGAITNLGTGVDCSTSVMSGWGQETNFGNLTLGSLGTYSPLDASGTNMSCGRYYFLSMTIDAQNAFGFPDDTTRGPTITDISLQYTSSPQKRLLHGRTFVNGIQNPLDSNSYSN